MSPSKALAGLPTSAGPLPALRFDLEWIYYPENQQWVVHDPLSGNFFRFNEMEYAAAKLLDGRRNLADILRTLKQRYVLRNFDNDWLMNLVLRMRQSFLLHAPTQTLKSLGDGQRSRTNFGRLNAWMNPLSIRIPLFNPRRLLVACNGLSNVVFHPLFVWLSILFACVAVFLVIRRLLESQFFVLDPATITADRWLLLAGCYIVVKSLHEFGHLLACSHYKVRSSEMGLLILCLMPCFYCDTTDAWRLPSRWQRIVVSAAGIYIELLMATLASFVWLTTSNDVLSLLSMNIMFVCSFSTIFINGNPFLRYDGYYILSDLWGVPNLHEQSRLALRRLLGRLLHSTQATSNTLDGNLGALSLFAIVSGCYRLFIASVILWLCWTYLPPMGLGIVAIAITTSMAMGMFLVQKRNFVEAKRSYSKLNMWQRVRTIVVASCAIGLIVFLLNLPFPEYVTARGYTDFEDKIPLYTNYDAKLLYAADTTNEQKAGRGTNDA